MVDLTGNAGHQEDAQGESPQGGAGRSHGDARAKQQVALPFGERLLRGGYINQSQLDAALRRQSEFGGRLGENLVRSGGLSERLLAQILSDMYRVPPIDLSICRVDPDAVAALPVRIAKAHTVLPILIDRHEEKRDELVAAMADPHDLVAIDEIRFATEMDVRPLIASKMEIVEMIQFYYQGYGARPYRLDAIPGNQLNYEQLVELSAEAILHEYAFASKADESAEASFTYKPWRYRALGKVTEIDGEQQPATRTTREAETATGSEQARRRNPEAHASEAQNRRPIARPTCGPGEQAPAVRTRPSTEALLRALVGALEDAGILSVEELRSELRRRRP